MRYNFTIKFYDDHFQKEMVCSSGNPHPFADIVRKKRDCASRGKILSFDIKLAPTDEEKRLHRLVCYKEAVKLMASMPIRELEWYMAWTSEKIKRPLSMEEHPEAYELSDLLWETSWEDRKENARRVIRSIRRMQ